MSKNNKNTSFTMKEKTLERALRFHGIKWEKKILSDGYGVQYKLTTSGFRKITINHYSKSGKVVVQPWDCPLAIKLWTSFAVYGELRTYRLAKKEGYVSTF